VRAQTVDVKLIVATNTVLPEAVAAGAFGLTCITGWPWWS
jgi:transcriptional regulator with GAF, ATPase, and Fis domain